MRNPLLKKQYKFLSLIFLLFTLTGIKHVFSQLNTDPIANLRSVMPPSPNASALGKYTDWPVSLYTGIPSVNLPIYDLQGRSITIPIAINYHAGGNKVGEIASWVGLGWSLNAGGIISRSVKGLPDETINSGYFAMRLGYANPSDMASSSSEAYWKTHAKNAADNSADSEPDIFSLNALGKSYKLLFNGDGSITTIPYSKIKITHNLIGLTSPSIGTFTVWLEDGTKLIFGSDNGYIETTYNNRNPSLESFVSSWCLKSVASTTGEIINFSYSNGTIKQDAYFSQSDVIEFQTSIGSNSTCAPVTHSGSSRAEIQTVYTRDISLIESDLIKLEFVKNNTERLDLEGGNALSEINIFSKKIQSYIRRYALNYEFSTAATGNEMLGQAIYPSYFRKRLKLAAIQEKAGDGTVVKTWTYEYNTEPLPSRRSYAQDHWGFYNGALSNTSLLPPIYFALPNNSLHSSNRKYTGFMPSMHNIGGKREGNGTFTQAEILTKINYPTGGYTSFTYEPNTTTVTEELFADNTLSQSISLAYSQNSFINEKTLSFTITKPQYVQLDMSSYVTPSLYDDRPNITTSAVLINSSNTSVAGISGNGSQWYNLTDAGTYTFKISTNADASDFSNYSQSITINANLTYAQSTGNSIFEKSVGGLRVKKIINFDPIINNSLEKVFQYGNPLLIDPININAKYLTTQNKENYNPSSGETCLFEIKTRNSATKFSMGSIQGGTIGYGTVTTLVNENGSLGKTVSVFSHASDLNTDLANIFPYPPVDSRENRRGLLLSETHFNNQNIPVKKTEHTYNFVTKSLLTAFKTGYSIVTNFSCNDPYGFCNINKIYYTISSEHLQQVSTVETAYDASTQAALATTTSFAYDNPDNPRPTRKLITNSKYETIETIMRGPLEKSAIDAVTPLSTDASNAIDQMLSSNIIEPVLQTETKKGAQLLMRTTTDYKIWPNSFVQPEKIKVQKAGYANDTRVEFTNYDVNGNLIEQRKTADVTQSYIYNYSQTYPIAQVTNASFSAISYTSFEADGKGNWDYGGTVNTLEGITGGNSYYLSTGNIERTGLNASQVYIVSYWLKDGSGSVSVGGTAKLSKHGFTLYEATVTGVTTLTISGSAIIDELRMYPKGAQMTTYTYHPLIGISSQCDANNKITYYEYDGFNRLKLIRDQDKNILKTFDYQYQQPQY